MNLFVYLLEFHTTIYTIYSLRKFISDTHMDSLVHPVYLHVFVLWEEAHTDTGEKMEGNSIVV